MDKNGKIFVAGHRGLVGSAIVRNLRDKGYSNIVTRTSSELDLTNQQAVAAFFAEEKPDGVFLAAAKVGGILANNTYRAEFIYRNLMIEANVIHHAWLAGVTKLLLLGSTCIYPRDAAQPMAEDELLTGPLEYTNEPYAVAKIAGIRLCESYNIQYGTDFLSVMPTNLYGPGDNFDLETSHVLPAMIRKMHLARCLERGDWDGVRADFARRPVRSLGDTPSQQELENALATFGITQTGGRVELKLWGTGAPLREFMWSEDMADACVHIMEKTSWSELSAGKAEKRNCHINIGTGKEISIRDLAHLVARAAGFTGAIAFDAAKPDGTMRKLTDPRRLHALGWRHHVEIEEGVERLSRIYAAGE